MTKRDTLLLACGSSESRSTLCTIFENDYNVLETSTIEQSRILLEQNKIAITAVLLDATEFADEDFDLLTKITKNQLIDNVPVLVIASSHNAALSERIIELGAAELICQPYSLVMLQHRLQTMIHLRHHQTQLQDLVNEKTEMLHRSNEGMVDILTSIIERRSSDFKQRTHYVRAYTEILLNVVARACPQYNLTEETIRLICSATALHDIGKISVPDSILNKIGPLTPEERIKMQSHTIVGSEIVQALKGSVSDEYIRYAYHICRYHHERWDGSGYPEGLSKDEIPICAQVVGLVDAYDALTNSQVYREAYSPDKAANMILNGECGAFSPSLLECFKQVNSKFCQLAEKYSSHNLLQAPPAPLVNQSAQHPEEHSEDTIEMMQAKYRSILHYLNASVFELDMDQNTYHIIYNPDPNLAQLNAADSFAQISDILTNKLIVPNQSASFLKEFHQYIFSFWEDKLHCQNLDYEIRSSFDGSPVPYQITLLRMDSSDSQRRRMMIICKRVTSQDIITSGNVLDNDFFSFTIMGIMDKICAVRYDCWLTIKQLSNDLCSLLGYSSQELEEACHQHMMELVHPDDQKKLLNALHDQLSIGVDFIVEYRLRHKKGHYIWILNKGRIHTSNSGDTCLYSLVIDISKSKVVEEILHQTLERQNIILSQTENVIFECDMECSEMVFSQKWQEMFGYDPIVHDVKNRLFTESHLHPQDIPKVLEEIQKLQNGSKYGELELRIVKSDGYYLWCQLRVTVQYDRNGEPLKMVGVIVNIDDKKRAAQALQKQAERDPLSNLLNKGAGTQYVEEYLRNANENVPSALIIIDLDNFKKVNDKYGHLLGDVIISQVSAEIRKLFRSNDIISRIGGDEFMVLMKHMPSEEVLNRRLDTLLDILHNKLLAQVPESGLGCSMGLALFPQHGKNFQDLFRHADMALYQAKAKGKNAHVIYDADDVAFQNRCSIPERTTTTPIDSDKSGITTADNLIRFTFQQLYESGDVEKTIRNILALVGQQLNVSRVYIFENSADNSYCTNTFEWCNEGISAEIENLQHLDYSEALRGYEKNFDEHGVFYCPDISILPQNQYDILAPQGILSMLQCSIRDQGVFRGFVGFDECTSNRLWTQEQIEALRFFSEMLSTFLLKKRAQDETDQRANNLSSILNKQNAWIYVIDPVTYEFKFLNQKIKELVPHVKEGMICHHSLMNRAAPCAECPICSIGDADFNAKIIFNKHLSLCVHSEATRIQWNGEEAYLITCHQIDPKFHCKTSNEYYYQSVNKPELVH